MLDVVQEISLRSVLVLPAPLWLALLMLSAQPVLLQTVSL